MTSVLSVTFTLQMSGYPFLPKFLKLVALYFLRISVFWTSPLACGQEQLIRCPFCTFKSRKVGLCATKYHVTSIVAMENGHLLMNGCYGWRQARAWEAWIQGKWAEISSVYIHDVIQGAYPEAYLNFSLMRCNAASTVYKVIAFARATLPQGEIFPSIHSAWPATDDLDLHGALHHYAVFFTTTLMLL